jgi:hypothetical protein
MPASAKRRRPIMIWYVATLSRYELVDAASVAEARQIGESQMPGRIIRTVRPATGDEIALVRYDERLRREFAQVVADSNPLKGKR